MLNQNLELKIWILKKKNKKLKILLCRLRLTPTLSGLHSKITMASDAVPYYTVTTLVPTQK